MPEFTSFAQFAGWFAIVLVVSIAWACWQPVSVSVRVGDDKFES